MCSRHWSAVVLMLAACTDPGEGRLQSAASTVDPFPAAGASGASGQGAAGGEQVVGAEPVQVGGEEPLEPDAPLVDPESETASKGDTDGRDAGTSDGPPTPDPPVVVVPGGPVTLWIAGDSTVANGNTPCPRGWGRAIGSAFDERVSVVNSAAGGRSVHTWLYNVQPEFDEATDECALALDDSGEPLLQARWQAMLDGMQSGDYLLIQFGINDGDPNCDRHVGIEAFKTAYGMMANAAKVRGAQPIFITPVSSIACNGTTPRGTRGGFVPATLEAGETFDVPVIDLHALSVQLYGELGFCPVAGGDVSAATGGAVGEFFCDDHTHFDQPGAERMAELMAGELAALGVGLGEYLR